MACEMRASRSAWFMFWLSWVSKPPIETKKICRLAPIALRAPITRATVWICCARPLFALLPVEGTLYCVGAATVDALKALWKVACAVIAVSYTHLRAHETPEHLV